jgi:outer membrane protein insertion porin family/translocation and assembly module TamA
VTFTIQEGPVVRVASVHIQVHDPTGKVGHLELPGKGLLDPDQPFEIEKYREAKILLRKMMGNRGYPLATVKAHARVNVQSNRARIRFEVEPGPRCTFGELRLQRQGLPVKEAVIRRAVTFKPGTLYDERKVDESQRNLYNLDIFKSAAIRPGAPLPDTQAVPMEVKVKPKKRQSFKFGIGYGTEDKFRVKAGWIYRNPAGWAGRFSLDAKYSSLYEGLTGKYVQPYFLGARNSLSIGCGTEKDHLESYDNLKVYANASLTRRLRRHWQSVFGYDLEMNRLEHLNVTDPLERARYLKDDDYLISSVSWALSQSRIDNEINPTSGHVFSFSVGLASRYLGSNLSYINPQVEVKAYHRSPFRTVLAGRLRIQSIKELGTTTYIPIFKRLFLGGSNTVRGYAYQDLGPKDSAGTPLGGLSALNANIELRRKVYGAFSAVLFLDAGVVSETAFDFPLNALRYGAGAGIRYDTLVGPIRLDLGYKLNPETAGEARWRIHFSIGQAF